MRWILPGHLLLLGATAFVGCQSAASRLPYSQDPLLLVRKPVEGRTPDREESPQLAFAEPRPPGLPLEALAAMPPAYRLAFQEETAVTSRPPGQIPASVSAARTALQPSLAQTAVRILPRRELEAITVSRNKVALLYGQASDFSWLRGQLQTSQPGQFFLDYALRGTEGDQDKRVLLEEDPRLAQLRADDFIAVRGKLASGASLAGAGRPPLYRIHDIWLVQRGN
jgi:hypothetical protein